MLRKWKWAFFISFLLGYSVLTHTLPRSSDGDDAYFYYGAAMKPWGEVMKTTFLPPEKRAYVYGRWRPFSNEFYPKLVWELDLSTDTLKILNWLVALASALCFAWGTVRALSLGMKLAPEAQWALATVVWWSPATLFTSTNPFYHLHLPPLFCGLAMGLISPMRRGRAGALRLALAALLVFLSFQSHENTWWYVLWFSGWLALLTWQGVLKKDAPRFWWPLAAFAAYLLIYRSFSRGDLQDWSGRGGFALSSYWLWTNASYAFLAIFNALSGSLPHWLGTDKHLLDITPLPHHLALILTVAAIALALTRKPKDPKLPKPWFGFWLVTVAIGVGSNLPYLVVQGHRFIHYTVVAADLLALWLVARCSLGKQTRVLPILLLGIANAMAAQHFITHWNWIELNVRDVSQFTAQVLSRPGFSECSSEKPCCTTLSGRNWGRDETVLNWNIGKPKKPAFIAEGTPGIECAQHLRYE